MKVKELRRRASMTQQEFSDYFGIPKRSIENWEAESRTPPDYLVSLMEYKLQKENLQEHWEDYGFYEILVDGKGKVVRCVINSVEGRRTGYPYIAVKDGWQNAAGCELVDLMKGLEEGTYKIS